MTSPDPSEPSPSWLAEHWWEFAAAVILSLATVASAWSGYQSTRWSGENSRASRAAADLRLDATQQLAVANRQMSNDVGIFAMWFEAAVRGDERLSALIEERFRPEFAAAFDSWRATGGSAELPPGSPFDQQAYQLAASVDGDRLNEQAVVEAAEADEFKQRAENYVLTAVLYASVLFFAGIASKMRTPSASHLAVGLSGLMFVLATLVMLSLPASVSF